MRSNTISLGITCALLTGQAQAQLPVLDIGMVALENGQLEVRMRPDAFFDGLFSSLTVSVRRDEQSVANLDGFTVAPGLVGCIGLSFSESVTEDGFIYDIYAGFGFSTLANQGTSWTAGQEFVLGHFSVLNGPGAFQIVQVCPPNFQGNYFASLNSVDQTGLVYEVSTSIADRFTVPERTTIFPNPSSGVARMIMDPVSKGQVVIDILDATGRTVQQHSCGAGSSTFVLDATTVAVGSYVVRVSGSGMHSTTSWIVTRP